MGNLIFATASAPTPAPIADVMSGITTVIQNLVGGGNVAFADSWVGSFLSSLVSSNGLLFIKLFST